MLSLKPDPPLDPLIVAVMREVDGLARAMNLTYFVCGAAARDIVLHHVYGIETGTATVDVDFGIAVENWDQFERIKAELIGTGRFKGNPKMAQRLYYKSPIDGTEYPVDIIPFGNVENPPNLIAWPPGGNEVMNVIGYQEALANALEIEIEKELVVPVISLPALALLKLFAWLDRGIENPKDAWDLGRLITNYHEAGNEDRLYGEEIDLLEAEGFDPTSAGPVLLGKDVRRIAQPETLQKVLEILSDSKLIDRLATQMAPRVRHADDRIAEAERLLGKFREGLQAQ